MLILTRYVGQALNIGDEITVTVMKVDNAQVKLGIQAQKNIPIDREEIHVRKKQNEKLSRGASIQCPKEETVSGTITHINKIKNYGFICSPGYENKVFFPAAALIDCVFERLEEGLDVAFQIKKNAKGYIADNVRIDI